MSMVFFQCCAIAQAEKRKRKKKRKKEAHETGCDPIYLIVVVDIGLVVDDGSIIKVVENSKGKKPTVKCHIPRIHWS